MEDREPGKKKENKKRRTYLIISEVWRFLSKQKNVWANKYGSKPYCARA